MYIEKTDRGSRQTEPQTDKESQSESEREAEYTVAEADIRRQETCDLFFILTKRDRETEPQRDNERERASERR